MTFIDRRLNSKNKSVVNRQRFIDRFKEQIKDNLGRAIAGKSLREIGKDKEKITIPKKDISEPSFGHGRGGEWEIINPGNQDFLSGDKVDRPKEGGGKGKKASQDGEGEDEFSFELSREEFMDLFFEDLALPNLIKTQLLDVEEYKSVRAGFTTDGVPSNLNVIRSLRQSIGRRRALKAPRSRELAEAEELLVYLLETCEDENDPKILAQLSEIDRLKHRLDSVPFIDPFDLRFNNRILVPNPISKAVMFTIMDVSGSMGEEEKDVSKRFFFLLYLFLLKNYEKVNIVFIKHHTIATEVDEEEFFYGRETGGTIVSSALELAKDIIETRYPPSEWNIYMAQCSDGDNWGKDSEICRDLLIDHLMPIVQYYAYIEIAVVPQNLWEEYEIVASVFDTFVMNRVLNKLDVYPVFRRLFEKKSLGVS